MDEVNCSNIATPERRRRRPIGLRPFDGEFPDDPYATVTDRGVLIGAHPIDPSIYGGGRVTTTIGVGRLACLAGLIHGRLVFEVAAHLWHPKRIPAESDPC